jgi:hypothetical protein
MSSRMIQQTVDRLFNEMMANVERRVGALSTHGRDGVSGTELEVETVLEVFQTSSGLEVWINGKKHYLTAAD